MALLGLKMALIHPKKVQIGYKLDQNTNLVNTFENNRRAKMQKDENSVKYGGFSLKNQHPMLKIAICEKSRKTKKLIARSSDLAHF